MQLPKSIRRHARRSKGLVMRNYIRIGVPPKRRGESKFLHKGTRRIRLLHIERFVPHAEGPIYLPAAWLFRYDDGVASYIAFSPEE